jgi:DNA-binding MarR family transcriptional regulator
MNSIDDISMADYQALAEFRYQIRLFLRFSEQAARATGLVPQQYQFMLALKGLPNGRKATISELAERLQIKHHSTVELVDRLVEKDLIRRSRDDQDQRRVIIQLTPHGEQLLKKLSLLHRKELQSTGPILVQTLKALITTNSDMSKTSRDGTYQSQERLEELP